MAWPACGLIVPDEFTPPEMSGVSRPMAATDRLRSEFSGGVVVLGRAGWCCGIWVMDADGVGSCVRVDGELVAGLAAGVDAVDKGADVGRAVPAARASPRPQPRP